MPDGEYDVSAHPDGFREARVPARAPASGVLVRLERGVEVAGEVVDEDGAPVAGAEVSVVPQADDDRPSSFGRGRTDREGRFAIAGLRAGAVVVLAQRAGEGADRWDGPYAHARVDLPGAGTGTVKLRYDPTLTISGQVIGPDGAPVAHAKVHAWGDRGPRQEVRVVVPGELPLITP